MDLTPDVLHALEQYRADHRNLSYSELARRLKVSQATVSDWVTGRSKRIRPNNFLRLRLLLGNRLAENDPVPGDTLVESPPNSGQRVPLITPKFILRCGGLRAALKAAKDPTSGVPIIMALSRGDFAFAAADDSMLPTVLSGDVCICDSATNAMQLIGSIVHVAYLDEQDRERSVVARLRELGEQCLFTSDHTTVAPLRVPLAAVAHIWEIVEIRRLLRQPAILAFEDQE